MQANANGRAFAWHEANVPDAAKAVKFYTEVVGWTTQSMPMGGDMGEYTMFCAEGTPVCGLMPTVGDMANVPPHWSVYIRVDDVDSAVSKAQAAGGKVVVPAFEVPTVGRMSLLQDDQGAHFWVFKAAPA